MRSKPVIRLLSIDDHEIVSVGIKATISRHPNLELVACAKNIDEGSSLANRFRPDVIIADINLPLRNYIEALTRIPTNIPTVRMLVFTKWPAPSVVMAALDAGVLGCVSKTSNCAILVEAILAVAKGRRFIDPRLADFRLQELLDDRTIGSPPSLGKREREVLSLVAWGHPNIDIGIDLGVSTKTVETYRKRACGKLQLRSRSDIVKFAVMSGWMDQ